MIRKATTVSKSLFTPLFKESSKMKPFQTCLAAALMFSASATATHAAVTATITEKVNVQSSNFGSASFPNNSFDDLTTLGPTDWAIWGLSSGTIVESNSKSGGSGIGSLTSANPNRSGSSLTSTMDVPTTFDFTDGVSPTSGTNVNGGVGMNRGNTINFEAPTPGPLFSFDVSVGVPNNTLYVWLSGKKLAASGATLKVLDGASTIQSIGFGSSDTDVEAGFVYEIVYGGDTTTSGTVTIEIAAPNLRQNDGKLFVHAAALEVVPEPASLALLGLGGLLMLSRRRKA